MQLGHVLGEQVHLLHLDRPADRIVLDVDTRQLRLDVPDEEIARRREAKGPLPWRPDHRERQVSQALKVYAHLVRSATYGATRRPLD